MTLDEYRVQLVEQLKKLRDERAARLLIQEADSNLQNHSISDSGQLGFWQALDSDLETAKRDSQLLLERQAAAALSQVIAAAQAVIAQHQQRVRSK
jgi:hypothetical protein